MTMLYDVIITVDKVNANSPQEARELVKKIITEKSFLKIRKRLKSKIGGIAIDPLVTVCAIPSSQFTIKLHHYDKTTERFATRSFEYCDGEIKEIENDEE